MQIPGAGQNTGISIGRTNLLIIPETEEEKEVLDQLGQLDQPLHAELRLEVGHCE